jgi:aerobic-type carbon monoxide dehydrogenase small subunit (CoxS/CutS family)/carbon monoxide dehydrogenase subunit G
VKAAPFRCERPASVKEALEVLHAEEGAKALAGGQSLVPMMAMRLARPTVLVDLAGVPGLDERGGARQRLAGHVEPRLTLVDALRHRLGLTGSHVGCEHGVCGACTVLVDGAAARSCLMFCVQAAGTEVTTVETLGEVDGLDPLQEAFRRHHGLQCGFCTPGFLMSSFDHLRDGPVEEAHLRAELSGVLCRCTGYAGIVDAVREVAESHPGGLPGPKALGRPILVRGGGAPAGEAAALEHSAERAAAPPPAGAVDLAVPEGEPNETVDVVTEIDAPPEETWELIQDFPKMSRLLPGVDLSRELGDGRDTWGGGVRADLVICADPGDGGGTRVRAQAKLDLSGRAAQFGRSLAGDVSRQLFAQFGQGVEQTLKTGEIAEPTRLRGGGLAWNLVRARLASVVRRIRS